LDFVLRDVVEMTEDFFCDIAAAGSLDEARKTGSVRMDWTDGEEKCIDFTRGSP